MKKLLVLFTMLSLAACSDDDNNNTVACTEVYTPGLNITVRNGNNTLTEGITVTATDGTYIEELVLVPSENASYNGAYERAGTYVITVTGEGYVPYTSEPIAVDADECHVITQERIIDLESVE
jgi:hypothetical protein